MSDKFVAYYCMNGRGRGGRCEWLEVQRAAVMSFLNRRHWTLVQRHTEEGTPSGRRPALENALAACREHNAALVVANPGQLAQDRWFLAELARAGVECWAVDLIPGDRSGAMTLPRRTASADRIH